MRNSNEVGPELGHEVPEEARGGIVVYLPVLGETSAEYWM